VRLSFQYKTYRRRFASVFGNAREEFASRQGLILRLEDASGRVGFGEASPIPSFGSESFAAATSAASGIGSTIDLEELEDQLRGQPCMRWALGCAGKMIEEQGRWPEQDAPWPVAGLAGDVADLASASALLERGYPCLKFKVGLRKASEEMECLDRFIELSEGGVPLRLDANGMLDLRESLVWLAWAAEAPVEFLEQPLAAGRESEMQGLAGDFPTALALDESLRSVDDLKRWRDRHWGGRFVVKPSLCGSYQALAAELEQDASDCVFSSSLESLVGSSHAIAVALRYSDPALALGFGVESLFTDRESGLNVGPFLQPGALPDSFAMESLWNRI